MSRGDCSVEVMDFNFMITVHHKFKHVEISNLAERRLYNKKIEGD